MRVREFLKHPVVHNALSLYGLQFAGWVLPLVTFPYLARVLRPQGFGVLVLYQSLAMWLSIVLEYGFNWSATREIARHRDNPERISEIVAGVMGAKCLLACAAVLIAIGSVLVIPNLGRHLIYVPWVVLYIVSTRFSPLWYFQGAERMVKSSSVDIVVRMVVAAGILLAVHYPGDGWRVLAIQAMGGVASTAVLLRWAYRQLRWARPNLSEAIAALRLGWTMFLVRGTVSLYTTANSIILGLFVSPVLVSYYGGAERIAKMPLSMLSPMTQAIYPRMGYLAGRNPSKAARVVRISMAVMGTAGTAMGVAVWLAAPVLQRVILGAGYEEAVGVLRSLSPLAPLIALNSVLGAHWMLPLGMDKTISVIVVGAGLLNVAAALAFAPRLGPAGMAVAVVLAEAFVTVAQFTVLRFRGMDPFNARWAHES